MTSPSRSPTRPRGAATAARRGETDLSVTVEDDDVPGVRVRPQSLTIREQDTSGRTYEVVLTGKPANNVTITIAGHSGTDVSVNPTSLTFTPMNWDTEKTVTVKAGNDADTTNDRVSLTHSATSTDGDYDGITIAGVTVRVTDNDIAQVTGVSVAPGNGQLVVSWTAVDNATGYRVQWKSGGQNYNTTDRQFTVTSSSTTSHTIIGLTNGTEYTVQVIATRTGANDGPPSEEMTGTPMAAGVTVSKTTLTVTEEDTTGDSYTVVLDSQTTANVTVTVAGHAGTDVTPTPASLTFTRMSWATAQTVTVTAGNDADTTDDTVTLTHSAASTDSDYDGITIAGVTVTVTDNDTDGGGGGGGGTGGGGTGGGGGGGGSGTAGGSGGGSSTPSAEPQGYLENPGPDSFQSGIGVLSGWVCAAETVEIEITTEGGGVARHVAAYGTERLDTAAACGDTNNGFGLLFNWNLLDDGEHAVVAYVDDVELDRATVTVTTLGGEFVPDVEGSCPVPDFPTVGETVTVEWQESKQNFVIASGVAPTGENRAGATDVGYLENPSSNSFQSGIGVLSGWVCAAEEVVIAIGHLAPQVAGYGTERLDTQDACGDTNNGFGLLFNWNLLDDGEHEVVAYVDDVELGRATVRVTTLGEEFLRGAEGECVIEDFPMLGETVTLAWQQNQQNFVVTAVE